MDSIIAIQDPITIVEVSEGVKGERGVSLENAVVREDGHLILEFDNGTIKDAGITALIDAATYRDEAKQSATEAKESEKASATSEQNAANSEAAAKSSEDNAADSKQSAQEFQTLAQKWAESTESPNGEVDTSSSTGKTQSSRAWALYSEDRAKVSENSAASALSSETHAKQSADEANASATAAATSEQNAEKSEVTATAQAQSATKSASNAKVSETNAKTSESNAKSSETNSKQSESNAASSEANALQYKNDAQASKDAAATSASNASKSEINAKASASSASASASSANQSATNAATSESHAAVSETNAQVALTTIQGIQSELEGELSKVSSALKYCGTVESYSDLPADNNEIGDMWNVRNADPEHGVKAGDNVVWDGEKWDNQSGYVDLSNYPTKDDVAQSIISVTYQGDTITFIHKDGSSSMATVNNVAHAISTDNDGSGNNIEDTYYKRQDAQAVHTSFQTSLNNLSRGKQDKLTFDTTPINNSVNPVTSGGIKASLDNKVNVSDTGNTPIAGKILLVNNDGKLDVDITGTAQRAIADGSGNNIVDTYESKSQADNLVKSITENEGKVTVTTQGGSQNSFYTGLNLLQRNKSYAVGDIAYSPNLPSWAYLECIEAGTTGASEPDLQSSWGGGVLTYDGSVRWRIRDRRCKYEVGDIVPKLITPKNYEYLLICDGSSFDMSQYPLLAEVFPEGVLPNLTERFLEGSATSKQYREAGLPNITGDFFAEDSNSLFWTGTKGANGAFNLLGTSMNVANPPIVSNIATTYAVQFNAKNSNAIYGSADTVQPASYTVTYYVCYGG